jgi:DNA-binding MarR family transcriptional regulator
LVLLVSADKLHIGNSGWAFSSAHPECATFSKCPISSILAPRRLIITLTIIDPDITGSSNNKKGFGCVRQILSYNQAAGSEGRHFFSAFGGYVGAGKMFWYALEELHRWERANLPSAATPVGNEILIWLLKSKFKRRPLKDLYRSSRFSEPTIRSCLKELNALGFVTLETSDDDMRTRYARATPKLEHKILEYRRRFQEVADYARKEPSSLSSQHLNKFPQNDILAKLDPM